MAALSVRHSAGGPAVDHQRDETGVVVRLALAAGRRTALRPPRPGQSPADGTRAERYGPGDGGHARHHRPRPADRPAGVRHPRASRARSLGPIAAIALQVGSPSHPAIASLALVIAPLFAPPPHPLPLAKQPSGPLPLP